MNLNLTNNNEIAYDANKDTRINVHVIVKNIDAFIENINQIKYHLEEIHKLYHNMPHIETQIVTMKNGEIQK